MRVAEIAAHRGTITDRYGEPLAVSTPVDSLWVNPKELALAADQIPRLAKALKRDKNELARRVTSNLDRDFLYLVRHMQPADAAQDQGARHPGRLLDARIPPLLPVGRSRRATSSASPTSTTAARKASSSRSTTGSPARTARSA